MKTKIITLTTLLLAIITLLSGCVTVKQDSYLSTSSKHKEISDKAFACPDFVGKTMDDLEQYKEKYNFVFVEQSGSAEGEDAGKYKTGQIYMQHPKANSQVKPGATITVYVQKQRTLVDVPEVKGYTAQKARELLESKQFNVIEKEEYSEDTAKGLVIKTNPAAESKKAIGSNITVYVSLGEAPELLDVTEVETIGGRFYE